jgi:cytochrome c551/c552
LLTTGGGLLFGGDVAGRFRAYDQKTGNILWEVNLGSQVSGFPVSFAVNGRQYIAISTGQAVSGSGHLALTPDIRVGRNNNLYVFALPEGTAGVRVTPRVITPPTAATSAPTTPLPSCRTMDLAESVAVTSRESPAGHFGRMQVDAGRALYKRQQCDLCHGATMGGTTSVPALNDIGFKGAWQNKSVNALLSCMKRTMPPGRAGTLSDAEYLQLIAAILEANGVKTGADGVALPADPAALARIRVTPGP